MNNWMAWLLDGTKLHYPLDIPWGTLVLCIESFKLIQMELLFNVNTWVQVV